MFVFVAALWGRTAGLIAAGLYAVVPMSLDMLAWHALANIWALVLLPPVLLAAGMALRGHLDLRWCAFLALFLVALAAAHRLSFLVAVLALLPCLVILVWQHGREGSRDSSPGRSASAVVGGAGVIVDLVQRNIDTGGSQGYRAFLTTKVDWEFVGRDLTTLFGILGAVALLVLLVAPALRGDAARFVLFGLLAAVLALSYAWVVHFPMATSEPPTSYHCCWQRRSGLRGRSRSPSSPSAPSWSCSLSASRPAIWHSRCERSTTTRTRRA